MAEKVVVDLKAEVEKVARENDQERFRILSGKLQDIIDMIAVVSLENTMLLRGMDALIVQRLGTSFLRNEENKATMREIDSILRKMDERNDITKMTLEEKIAKFQEILQRGREKKSSD